MKRIHRSLDSLSYVAGATQFVDLPKEFIYTGLHLDLAGSVTVTGALTLVDEVPARLVRRFELVADGEVLQSWPGEFLAAWNFMFHRRYPPRVVPGTSVATHPFRQSWFLPLRLERSLTPGVAYFDPSRYRSVQLRVTWGTEADIYSAGTTSAFSATLTVTTRELMATAAQLSSAGRFWDVLTNLQTHTTSGSVTGYTVQLPREQSVWGLLIRSAAAASPKLLSDLVNRLKLVERKTITVLDLTSGVMRSIMDWDLGPSEDFETPSSTYNDRIEAYYYIDLLERGIVDRVRPQAWQSYDLVLDLSAAAQIDVMALQLRE